MNTRGALTCDDALGEIMIKELLAIIAAAACAGVIIEFIPEAASAVAAGVSATAQFDGMSVSDGAKHAVLDAARVADHRKAVCAQAWPYYEPACLHDGRRVDGKMRVVRVIVTDHWLRATPRKRDLRTSEQIHACCN